MTEQEEIKIIKGTEHPEEFNPELREPPLLSSEEFLSWLKEHNLPSWYYNDATLNRQAQREADIKWMKKNCYLKAERELPVNQWLSGYYVSHPHYEPTHDAIEEFKDEMLKEVDGVAFRACEEFK